MAPASNIKRRGGVYYAQLAVPADAQAIIGRKTLDRSLGTKDANEAKRRVLDVIAEFRDMIAAARRGEVARKRAGPTLSPAQLAKRDYEARIAVDAARRKAQPAYASLGVDLNRVHELRDAIAGKLTDEALIKTVEPTLKYFHARGLIDPRLDAAGWIERARALAVSEYEAFARVAERDDGDFSGEPEHPILKNVEPEPAPTPEGEGIMELFDRYAAENAKGISADTLQQARRDVKLFADTIGNPPATKITKKQVGAWKDLLMRYPVKAAEIAAFKGKTMREIIAANEAIGKPTISDATVNRYLSALGAFCGWLVNREYLDRNPTEGMFQDIDKTARQKPIFTVEQMNVLFATAPFTGRASPDEWRKPGDLQIRDHRFWLPLVMLYSGARPAEIAQLLCDDIRQEHGHWIMHITTLGDDEKTVKTKGSMRVVPIHSELIKLGFVKHRHAMAAAGEKRLFPEATRNARGQMAAEFSRDFGRHLDKLGVKNGRGLSLYSFRHGTVDALRRAGYPDEQIAFLVGHTKHTMTAQYGHLPEGTLRQRAEMVEAIEYEGLRIPHQIDCPTADR